MLSEYPIFVEYHYYIKKWLETIMSLSRLDPHSLNIPIVYASPRRAFSTGSSSLEAGDAGGSHLYAPPNEGNNFLPIFTFHLANAELKTEKIRPFEHILLNKIQDNNEVTTGYIQSKPLMNYEISYTGTLYCGLMQDADILMFKFLTEFKPQCYLWVGDQEHVGDLDYGVYACMTLEGVTDGTEYEPGDMAERVVRKDFTWKIDNAYVPTTGYTVSDEIVQYVYTDVYDITWEIGIS